MKCDPIAPKTKAGMKRSVMTEHSKIREHMQQYKMNIFEPFKYIFNKPLRLRL